MTKLFSPRDTEEAYRYFGANCGPCSLSAIVGRPVMEVLPFIDGFEIRRYMNPTHMKAALLKLGFSSSTPRGPHGTSLAKYDLPVCGLAFVQIEGPWEDPGVPIGAAYRHTHWIACQHDDGQLMIYDVNNGCGWTFDWDWEKSTIPRIIAATKKATGWRVRTALHVSRVPAS